MPILQYFYARIRTSGCTFAFSEFAAFLQYNTLDNGRNEIGSIHLGETILDRHDPQET